MENQPIENKDIALADVCDANVITIRCLSAIPVEVEALLAEIADQEEQTLASK